MKSIAEKPPILTVHEDSGDYILRVGDTRYRGLVVGVSRLLTDARRLIVVTPGDVKFFVMGGSDGTDNTDGAGGDISGDPVREVDEEPIDEAVIAEQESHSLPNAELEEVEDERPLKTVRKRKPLNPDVKVGHAENCQRCGGTGKARVMMPDNSAAETACPICRGEGTIKRYGARR